MKKKVNAPTKIFLFRLGITILALLTLHVLVTIYEHLDQASLILNELAQSGTIPIGYEKDILNKQPNRFSFPNYGGSEYVTESPARKQRFFEVNPHLRGKNGESFRTRFRESVFSYERRFYEADHTVSPTYFVEMNRSPRVRTVEKYRNTRNVGKSGHINKIKKIRRNRENKRKQQHYESNNNNDDKSNTEGNNSNKDNDKDKDSNANNNIQNKNNDNNNNNDDDKSDSENNNDNENDNNENFNANYNIHINNNDNNKYNNVNANSKDNSNNSDDNNDDDNNNNNSNGNNDSNNNNNGHLDNNNNSNIYYNNGNNNNNNNNIDNNGNSNYDDDKQNKILKENNNGEKKRKTKKNASPSKVMIMAYRRSGSSFIGEMFNRNPRVFYLFEPIYPVEKIAGKGQYPLLYDTMVSHVLDVIYTCSFNKHPFLVDFLSKSPFRLKSEALKSSGLCKIDATPQNMTRECKPLDQTILKGLCNSKDYVVVKSIRTSSKKVSEHFSGFQTDSKSYKLNLIHLVRDPRAIISSRLHLFIHTKMNNSSVQLRDNQNLTNALRRSVRVASTNLCSRIQSDLKYGRQTGPDHYMLLRFEDAAMRPRKIYEKVSKFSGIKKSEVVEDWLKRNTRVANTRNENDEYSTSRNSTASINGWMRKMPYKLVVEVQSQCGEVMKILGYVPATSERELMDGARSLVIYDETSL